MALQMPSMYLWKSAEIRFTVSQAYLLIVAGMNSDTGGGGETPTSAVFSRSACTYCVPAAPCGCRQPVGSLMLKLMNWSLARFCIIGACGAGIRDPLSHCTRSRRF
jgi:hypothetical protein